MRALLLISLAACSSSASSEPPPARCDLAGNYRTRFVTAGQQMWLRFRIDNQAAGWKGTLTPPIAFETIDRGVEISQHGDRCSFDAKVRTTSGTIFAQLSFDTTGAAKGSVRTADARLGSLPLTGVHELGAPKSKHACIKPGKYQLVVPSEQTWVSDNKAESCDAAKLELPFLVEYVGDQLVIDQLDPDGNPAWAGEDIREKAPCEVDVRFRHFKSWVSASLTFSGDTVTAGAFETRVAMEDKGGTWECHAFKPVAWVQRMPE